MSQDSVKVSLEIATQAAEIALKNIKKQTEENKSAWDVFKGNFAAGLAIDSLKGAYNTVANFVSSVIDESAKAEQSVQNLNVALKNAGLYSERTSQEFQALGDSIEQTTKFSGDAVESSVALLASLTKLNKDGIKQAAIAATDLAATLNIDVGSATDMIIKAVNGNVTAFGKLGIKIHEGRTNSENLAATLKALSSQQGAATKSADTYSGAIAKLDNQKGKLLESIGNLITQNPIVTAGIEKLTGVFISLSTFIGDNKDEITDLMVAFGASTAIVAGAAAAMALYTTITGGASAALTVLQTAATAAWAAVTGPIGIAVLAIAALGVAIYGAIKYWDNIKIATFEATAAVLDYASKAAGVFSSDMEKTLKAQAQALRDKAQAVREAQAAEAEAAANKKSGADAANDEADRKAQELKHKQELEELKKYYAEARVAKKEHDDAIRLSNQERDLNEQADKTAHQEAMRAIEDDYDGNALARRLEIERQELLNRQQYERDALQAASDGAKARAMLIEDEVSRNKAVRDAAYKADIQQQQLQNKQQLELQKQSNKNEEELAKQKMANKKDTWNTLLSLQNSSNKELAAAGKAFAIYDIAVNTPVAIGKALSAYPPPFNFAAAALVGAAMASQAAAIAGLNFASGGIVPGTSISGDKIAANVNSREMVLNVAQQKRLFEIANGAPTQSSDGNATTNNLLAQLIDAVKSSTSIQIDGREIVAVMRNGLQSGRTI